MARAATHAVGSQGPGHEHSLWRRLLVAVLSIRYIQQSLILTWKNLTVAWRNRRATILRLFAPFVFLLLALVIQLALDATSKRQERIREAEIAPLVPIDPIPSCNADLYIASKQCVTFLYSPNTSNVVQDIIDNVRLRNTPAIGQDKVLGFASRLDAEDWMMSNPESTLGAVHFTINEVSTPPSIQYTLQTNTTTKGFKGNYQSPVTFFTLPLASAVAREVSRVQVAAAGGQAEDLVWDPQLRAFPHPQLRSIGMVGYVLGPFIFAACMFGMVMQLGAVVGEKEVGLVTALRLMGLRQSAYWTSWIAADLLLGFATALSIVIWGLIMRFRFFVMNDFGVLLLLFWLFTLALSSFSYFLSTFMSRAQSATYTGFAVFLIGWICQTVVIFGVPYDPETYFAKSGVGVAFFWIFALLPWCPLSKATMDLATATNTDKSPGLRWSQRESYCRNITDVAMRPPVDPTQTFVDFDCLFPINQCYITLIVQAVGWLLLAIYLDNVLPGPNKRARPPWYFLMPSYWMRTRGTTCGLATKQQHELLSHVRHGHAAQHGTAHLAGGTAAGLSLGLVPRQPAQLQDGRAAQTAWQQQQHQGADARLDMAGTACTASGGGTAVGGGGTDEDVAAEEAAMQALLGELLPVAAAARRRSADRGLSEGGHGQLSSTPSWPTLQSVVVSQKQLPGNGSSQPGTPSAHEFAGSIPSSSTDAEIQLPDRSAAGKAGALARSSSGGTWDFAGFAVAVFGLRKVFKGSGCTPGCRGGGTKDFHALRGVWLGIRPGQLFALLGPNGAGKTTMINCLTGLIPPSGGEMLLCGESILTEGGLDRATGLIGVCPQFDVLWGELTGREHLLVAGHVKGLPWTQVSGAAEDLLTRVQLQPAAGVRSSSYSGGMKRRLSVAVALVGDPKVLFLDEPTTGMDPISRRAVWDVIQEAKLGRAVVLTTHSMEEADVLGDRIGIVARGRLRALGGSIRLKQKFGTGYVVLVSFLDHNAASSSGGSSKHLSGLRQRRRSGSKAPGVPSAAAAVAAGPGMEGLVGVLGEQQQQQQQQQHGLSPRSVVLSPSSNGGKPLGVMIPSSIAEEPGHSSSSSSSSRRSGDSTPPGSPRSAAAAGMSAARAAVRKLFAAHLDGLVPAEENKRSLRFIVPGRQQQQLVGLLQQLEAAIGSSVQSPGSSSSSGAAAVQGLGEADVRAVSRYVADVQLSLTSLEEVFLSIVQQAELEASTESGTTVSITLPDSGRQVLVSVGQDWVDDVLSSSSNSSSSWGGVRSYFIKWVQDESGALAVLEVLPAVRQQQQQQQQLVATNGAYGSRGAGAAVAPVAC